jgi:hypothetical protein
MDSIAHVWHGLPDYLKWIAKSLGGLTLAGFGAFVTWFLGLRKLNAEVKEINLRIKAMQNAQLISNLASTLVHRANCLEQNTVMSTARWASLLGEHSNLIREVLESLRKDGLAKETTPDVWMVGYSVTRIQARRA